MRAIAVFFLATASLFAAPTGTAAYLADAAEQGDRAAVRVRFDFGKQDDAESPRAPLVILRREADVWRVDDIRTDDGFSFRRTLAD